MPTLVVIADLIGSKKIADEPGGYDLVRGYVAAMRGHLQNVLRPSDGATTYIIEEGPSRGDSVEFLLRPTHEDDFRSTADVLMLCLHDLLTRTPDSNSHRFRYTVFTIEGTTNYLPRLAPFERIGKKEGKLYHLAIERGVINKVGQVVADLYSTDPHKDHKEVTIPVEAESMTAFKFDLYFKVNIVPRHRLWYGVVTVLSMVLIVVFVVWLAGYGKPQDSEPLKNGKSEPNGNGKIDRPKEKLDSVHTIKSKEAVAIRPELLIDAPLEKPPVEFTTGDGQGGRVVIKGRCLGLSQEITIKLDVIADGDPLKVPRRQPSAPKPDKEGNWSGWVQVGDINHGPEKGQKFTVIATMKADDQSGGVPVRREFTLGEHKSSKGDAP